MEEEFKLEKAGEVRVRIAPSPTGPLHLGTARTALFNFLFARKYQGIFILRIEDTDVERSKPEFEKDIIENLKWLGIEWDEGPDVGGDFGPYRQSQRKEIYKKYLEKLLAEGKAYYCFCTKEELESERQYQLSIGQAPRYSGKCANLKKEEVEKYLKEGKPSVIRLKVPTKKIEVEDLVRGKIEFDSSLIGDFIIAKNFSYPLYNFACVVDDYEMRISHVIRGEDHLSNTPKQILIQEALGFPRPKYAHLPLILGPDRSKLSKRHGAVSISEYRKQGFLPEALVNFIAFLGWHPKTERYIYSLPALIKDFSLEKIQKGGAIFNIKRLEFLNGFYIRQKSIEKLTELCLPYLIESKLIEKI
jgi:nondiscriminating glutamyl-tRNA synthetase